MDRVSVHEGNMYAIKIMSKIQSKQSLLEQVLGSNFWTSEPEPETAESPDVNQGPSREQT